MPLTVKTGAMKVKDPSSGNYVDVDMSLGVDYAPINSPEFAGTPKAPTATSGTNNTQIATTAFVQGLVSTEASARQAADSALQSSLTNEIIRCDTAIAIPSSGNNVVKTLAGLTAAYELIRWNFSSSAENSPPVNLTWGTYDNGTFVIVNNSGTTSETIKPVFAKATAKIAT